MLHCYDIIIIRQGYINILQSFTLGKQNFKNRYFSSVIVDPPFTLSVMFNLRYFDMLIIYLEESED